MHYALGKELEDLGDWDAAFAAFDAGARARRTTIDFDEQAEVDMYEALQRVYTQEWLADSPGGCDDPSPVFVVGQPRTGTTLVERIITSQQFSEIDVRSNGGSKHVLNFCANNYLGLANRPELIEAAKKALDRYGYGVASVRFICGAQDVHRDPRSQIQEASTICLSQPGAFAFDERKRRAIVGRQDGRDHIWIPCSKRSPEVAFTGTGVNDFRGLGREYRRIKRQRDVRRGCVGVESIRYGLRF